MHTQIEKIKIGALVEGYSDSYGGVVEGYNGDLNIRPSYQREYLHDKNPEFKRKLIESIYHDRPINMVYFAKREAGEYKYELLDGQQRIITICKFIQDMDFHIFEGEDIRFWDTLSSREQNQIRNYDVYVCVCTGQDEELIKWFQTINTGSHELSAQELRNAIYNGPWVTDAKRYFTSNGNRARMCRRYMTGDRTRQDHLETAIMWAIQRENQDVVKVDHSKVCRYMARERNNSSAYDLWEYISSVNDWVESIFYVNYSDFERIEGDVVSKSVLRRSMQWLGWTRLFEIYGSLNFHQNRTRRRQIDLLLDNEVTDKRGIYEYILSGEIKEKLPLLSLRTFTKTMKKEKWQKVGKSCEMCDEALKLEDAEADHIDPWVKGGKTIWENLQILCASCHGRKTIRQMRASRL